MNMILWIARDKCGELYAFNSKPELNKSNGRFITENCYYFLDEHLFPEITFENSPQQVELISSEEYKRLKECEEICKTESDYGDKHYC